jgi:phage repressor protein C with HTH and peptisase S24 domain/DNA-binding XRE family transcriptional regulator
MSLGRILRERREKLNLTLDQVAKYTGFSKPYLSTIETGKVNNPPSDSLLKKLEKILKFDKGYLLYIAHKERMPDDIRRDFQTIDAENRKYRDLIRSIIEHKIDISQVSQMLSEQDIQTDQPRGDRRPSGNWIPIINKVAAGYPAEFDDLGYPVGIADDYILAPDLHDPNAFAVRVIGDSMEPKYKEGDIVIFSPAADVQSGDDCFVRFEAPHETTFKRVFYDEDGRIRLQPRNEKYPPQFVKPDRLNGVYRAVIQHRQI